jgi:hypothetical protein
VSKRLRALVVLMAAAVLGHAAPAAERASSAPWAGRYCSGDGLSSVLRLDLRLGGYQLTWGNDAPGNAPTRTTGGASRTGDLVRLEPAPFSLPEVYRIVPWGSRTYLVPKDRLADFCASRLEPRAWCVGSYFVRTLDGVRPAGAATTAKPGACSAK